MASFAEMIYGTAQDSAQHAGEGLASGVAQGAELAMKAEQVQLQKQNLKRQQQELEMQKWSKIGEMYSTYDKMPEGPGKKVFGTQVIPANLRVMEMDQALNPAVADMMYKDPSIGALINSRVMEGRTTQADAILAAQSPDKFGAYMNDLGWKTSIDEKKIQGTVESYGPEFAKSENEALQRKASIEAAKLRGAGQTAPADKEITDFGKLIANPSSRADLGTLKRSMNAADAVLQLTDGRMPKGLTDQQRIEYYNKLTPAQEAEVVKSLDRLLSQSNPTVHGQESLETKTWGDLQAKYGQAAFNVPMGAQKGAFIANYVDTVNRERALAESKYRAQSQVLIDSHPNAKQKYGPQMQDMIDKVTAVPETNQPKQSAPAVWQAELSSKKDRALALVPEEQAKFITGFANKHGMTEADVKKALGVK
jgi:hypothetical protein